MLMKICFKKLDFSFPYEGYKEELVEKQCKAENYKSHLSDSIEKKASIVNKLKQLGYRAAEDIVADIWSY